MSLGLPTTDNQAIAEQKVEDLLREKDREIELLRSQLNLGRWVIASCQWSGNSSCNKTVVEILILTDSTSDLLHVRPKSPHDRESFLEQSVQRGELKLYKAANQALQEKYIKLQRRVTAQTLVNENLERETSTLIDANESLHQQIENLRRRARKNDPDSCSLS